MKFWVFLVLAFVVLLSSCQIFFLAGVYEELQDRGIASGGTKNIPNTSSSIVYIYVSGNGNDANDGLSPSTPVRTLVRAMEVANDIDSASNVLIKVGSGDYTPGSGLSSSGSGFVINRPNVIISGGWNIDFSSVVSKSVLDGNNNLYHVVMIRDVTNVRLENLVIRGGRANGSDPDYSGGGIYVSNVSYLVIESNVVIRNNSASDNGGGVYLRNSQNITISGSVYNNSANWGGGLYLWYSSNNTISGSVYSNSANASGGGLYLVYSPNTTISGSVYSNSADLGGGLYLNSSKYNTISGSVYGNSANQYGGGLYLWESTSNTISGNVYGNSATNYGGGLYLGYSPNTTISGSVYGNSATNSGGGVYLNNSDYFTNTGWITNNTVTSLSGSGGGVYTNGSHLNSSFTNVINNIPNNFN